jgi:glycosyltransferase involved in cell wall biosynthesis
MPNVKFVYAGDHKVVYERFFERWQPLVEANREHLIMLGLITDHQRLANFYALCDVFALPSRTDCFPSVQIEAVLCGTPVVATNIPGAREVVRATQQGLLVEPGNERALADGLLQVLEERESYLVPHERVCAIFDPNKSVIAYERLLQSMVKGS